MNPEVAVGDAGTANEAVGVGLKRAAKVGAVASGEPLAVWVVDNKAALVIADENDDMAEGGEVAVNNDGVAACEPCFGFFNRGIFSEGVFAAVVADDLR